MINVFKKNILMEINVLIVILGVLIVIKMVVKCVKMGYIYKVRVVYNV